MSTVTIFFTSVRLAADLLEHGTNLVGTTRPDRRDFPSEAINKDAIAGDTVLRDCQTKDVFKLLVCQRLRLTMKTWVV